MLCAKLISELSHRNELLFFGLFYVGYHGIPSEYIHSLNIQNCHRNYLDNVWREPPTNNAHTSHIIV